MKKRIVIILVVLILFSANNEYVFVESFGQTEYTVTP